MVAAQFLRLSNLIFFKLIRDFRFWRDLNAIQSSTEYQLKEATNKHATNWREIPRFCFNRHRFN